MSMKRTNKNKSGRRERPARGLVRPEKWFDTRERYRVSASASTAELLLSRLERAAGELIVMGCTIGSSSEVSAGGENGSVLRRVRRRCPDAPIIMLTSQTDPSRFRSMHAAGAAAVVSMEDDVRELDRVCSRVMSGMTQVMSKSITDLCDGARSFDGGAAYRDVRLTVKPFSAAS
jgi:DNA-binding NarL/FixJ family response regulator